MMTNRKVGDILGDTTISHHMKGCLLMKSTLWNRAGRLWCAGLLLFALRLAQNRTGFDPDTGLSLPSVPGVLLVACLAAAAVLELWLARRRSRECPPFSAHFAAPGRETTLLVCGCILLAGGGALQALLAVTASGGIAAAVSGLLALVSGGGLLLFVRRLRAGEELSAALILPALFFGVFLVLAVYLPAADDPVLARYYLQLLAAAMTAYAFSQLAGFLREESRPCFFTPVADLAVLLCIAALADGTLPLVLMYGGCALVLSGFLLLQQEG